MFLLLPLRFCGCDLTDLTDLTAKNYRDVDDTEGATNSDDRLERRQTMSSR